MKRGWYGEDNKIMGAVFSIECAFVPGVSETRDKVCAECGEKYKNYWALNWSNEIKRCICPACYRKLTGNAPKVVSAKQFMSIVGEKRFDSYYDAHIFRTELIGGKGREKGYEKRKTE